MLWYLSLHFPIPGLERLCSLADGTMWVARRWFPPSQGRAQNQLILSVGTCQISISEHAQCVPENQTAPASPTRLALSHSLTPVWGFLSFPERNLSLISVFLSLSWLPQLYLSKQRSREDEEVFQFSTLSVFTLKRPLKEGVWDLSFTALAFPAYKLKGICCWFQTDDVLPLTAPLPFLQLLQPFMPKDLWSLAKSMFLRLCIWISGNWSSSISRWGDMPAQPPHPCQT